MGSEDNETNIHTRIQFFLNKLERCNKQNLIQETSETLKNLISVIKVQQDSPLSLTPPQLTFIALFLSHSKHLETSLYSLLLLNLCLSRFQTENELFEASICILQSSRVTEKIINLVSPEETRAEALNLLLTLTEKCTEKIQQQIVSSGLPKIIGLVQRKEFEFNTKAKLMRILRLLSDQFPIRKEINAEEEFLKSLLYYLFNISEGLEKGEIVAEMGGDQKRFTVYALGVFYNAFFGGNFLTILQGIDVESSTKTRIVISPKGFPLLVKLITAQMSFVDAFREEEIFETFNLPLRLISVALDNGGRGNLGGNDFLLKLEKTGEIGQNIINSILQNILFYISIAIDTVKNVKNENDDENEKLTETLKNQLILSFSIVSAIIFENQIAKRFFLKIKLKRNPQRNEIGEETTQNALMSLLEWTFNENGTRRSIVKENLLQTFYSFFNDNLWGQKMGGLTIQMAAKIERETELGKTSLGTILLNEIISFFTRECVLKAKNEDEGILVQKEKFKDAVILLTFILKGEMNKETKEMLVQTHVANPFVWDRDLPPDEITQKLYLPRILFECLLQSEFEDVRRVLCALFVTWFKDCPKAIRMVYRTPKKYLPRLVSLYLNHGETIGLKWLSLLLFSGMKNSPELELPPSALERPLEYKSGESIWKRMSTEILNLGKFQTQLDFGANKLIDIGESTETNENPFLLEKRNFLNSFFVNIAMNETKEAEKVLQKFEKTAKKIEPTPKDTKNAENERFLVLLNKQRTKLKEFSKENQILKENNIELRKEIKILKGKMSSNHKGEKESNGMKGFVCSRECALIAECEGMQRDVADLLILVGQQDEEIKKLKDENGRNK